MKQALPWPWTLLTGAGRRLVREDSRPAFGRIGGCRDVGYDEFAQPGPESVEGSAGRVNAFDLRVPVAGVGSMQGRGVVGPQQHAAVSAPLPSPLIFPRRRDPHRRSAAIGGSDRDIADVAARFNRQRDPSGIGRPAQPPGPGVLKGVVAPFRQHFDLGLAREVEHPHRLPIGDISDAFAVRRVGRQGGVRIAGLQQLLLQYCRLAEIPFVGQGDARFVQAPMPVPFRGIGEPAAVRGEARRTLFARPLGDALDVFSVHRGDIDLAARDEGDFPTPFGDRTKSSMWVVRPGLSPLNST